MYFCNLSNFAGGAVWGGGWEVGQEEAPVVDGGACLPAQPVEG